MKHKLIGIDLAKNVFQVCAVNHAGKLVFNHKVGRARLAEVMTSQNPTQVAMEACASAHYWGRKFERMGHHVILIPPQHVQPFVRGGKSDARDALAIVEAAQRPKLHSVPIKSALQQDLQSIHRVRSQCIGQVTAVGNQIRGIAREYGVEFKSGIHALVKQLPEVLEDGENELTSVVRQLLFEQLDHLRRLRLRSQALHAHMIELASQDPALQPAAGAAGCWSGRGFSLPGLDWQWSQDCSYRLADRRPGRALRRQQGIWVCPSCRLSLQQVDEAIG
ncbi:MAG: IS110 family transposase [Pseudomonadota bacterium]|nr:MAG: IS110 family transposase [Pseudomonadota bacterium]